MDVGKHQHHFARGRSGQEVPGREAVRQTLAQITTAVPDAGTPHPGLGAQVGRQGRSLLLPQRRERPRFGLRQGNAGVRDRQLHHQRHIRLQPPAATSMGGSGTGGLVGQSGESDAVTAPSPPPAASSAGRGGIGVLRDHLGRGGGIGGGITLLSLSTVTYAYRRRPPRRWEGVEPAVWLVNRGKATPSLLPLRHRPHLRRGGEASAFCEITWAAEGALGGASPFFHCRRFHRRRKETPAVYVVNRRSGVNRTT